MIISRTPYRISFFGGGTDYPAWYTKHGGTVLAASIDKYCYLTCRYLPPFFEHNFRLVYSKIESCMLIDEIDHPAVRETLRFLGVHRGLEIHHDGDLPARSGMGSSSAFTVGLLHALYALMGKMPETHRLATESIYIEQELIGETVGSQDQVTAAYGGLNHIVFMQNGEVSVRPVPISSGRLAELSDHLMLFYTGIKRTASNVADSYVTKLDEKKRQLRVMQDLVKESLTYLTGSDDLRGFGELLNESWQLKRSLSPTVSNDSVDGVYETALKAGAIGGKITGAGGGGFLMLFAPPEAQARIREELHQLIHVPFKFEFSGSQIIFIDREEDYLAEEHFRANHGVMPFRELELPTGYSPSPK